MYQIASCFRLILVLIIAILSFSHWSRSRRPGFAWIGAALVAATASTLLSTFLVFYTAIGARSRGPFFYGFVRIYPLAGMLLEALFFVLILVGVQAFFAESVPANRRPLAGRIAWRAVALEIRRLFFGITGLAFVISGPLVVALRGGSTVGAGCMATLTGAVCLWLALHPRSPLAREVPDESKTRSGPGDLTRNQDSPGSDE